MIATITMGTRAKIFAAGLALLCLHGACRLSATARESVAVEVAHPALNGGSPLRRSLMVDRDAKGRPHQYALDVDSVSCGESVCDIVKVRLFWDALGGYLRYELPGGGTLTRQGHAAFTPADHEKLHLILADPDSRLKNFTPESVSAPAVRQAHDVDAVTKPTPLFYQTAVVRGAVYTCYTLWHWVHGGISAKIRELTSAGCTRTHLLDFAAEGPERFFEFALEEFAAHGEFDDAVAEIAIRRSAAGSAAMVQAALHYFDSALAQGRDALYCSAFLRLFAQGNSQKRTLCLRSLDAANLSVSEGFYDSLAVFLPALDSYFELHLLLNLLDKRNPDSAETAEQVVKVLANDNFLIARRAYWYLKERPLSAQQTLAVSDFEKKYAGRL